MDKEAKRQQLKELINYYAGGNNAEFARLMGVSPQGVSTWISRGSFDVELIYAKCENISSEWLLTGKGTMLRLASDTVTQQPLSTEETLLSFIREKDAKIEEQAKQIGRLEAENEMLRKKDTTLTVAGGAICAAANE